MMSNQNLILHSTSIALLSLLAVSNLSARAIDLATTAKSQVNSSYIAQNQTAAQFNNAGVAKQKAGDDRGALADFNKAIELDPNNAVAYINRGSIKEGSFLEIIKGGALADFNKAIELDPNNAVAYYMRGKLNRISDTGKALADFSKAIELDPKFVDAYKGRVSIKYCGFFIEKGCATDIRGALADYDKLVEITPKDAANYYNRASIKIRELKDYQGGLADLDKAIERRKDSRLYYERANLKKEHFQDYQGTLADYNKAIECLNNQKSCENGRDYHNYNPIYLDKDIEIYLDRASLKHQQLNDIKGAIADYQQAGKLARAELRRDAGKSDIFAEMYDGLNQSLLDRALKGLKNLGASE
jgi:tetratricopeptide (TPR) repeat protein